MVSGILTVLPRLTAFVSVAVAVYVVVGSWMFPAWWYGLFFWRSPTILQAIFLGLGQTRLQYVRDALRYLVYSRLVSKIVADFVLAIVLGAILKSGLFPLTDKYAGRIVFIAWLAVAVDVFPLYLNQKPARQRVRAHTDSITRAMRALSELGPPLTAYPKIESPIHFYDVDDERVLALYSQIRPELEEREHTVGTESTLSGEARAGLPGASMGIGGHVERAVILKRTYGRNDPSGQTVR